ncbi:hypothetical protein B0A79_10670 [Flavobacterium piscis]|uniref:Glycosyltransferase n=1 Tax=Flavobacterium piscis TaxID=1114874 RepID=A0ABX2XP40_9FLAO|nr:glycosyltransferase [Flavobacterium piscis]OCB77773.1 hypothetical protein FLP_02310 [Flavobacterium piscis]OXG04607.1 hypothetical protein B0A79_10670 [Flavobacterium piscis]
MGDRFKHYKIGNSKGIIILDDILPSTLSPWRSYEYAEICRFYENTRIKTDATTFEHYAQGKSFEENLKLLTANYPALSNKIKRLKYTTNLNSQLIYMLFYNNLKKHFEIFERNKNPFTFTLYPGGGFGFNDVLLDENLKKYFDSKNFKGVIVNQNITKKYLIENSLCDPEQVNLISGVPLNLNTPEIQNFEYQKETVKTSLLFFANKYTEDGNDKGFDVFQKIVFALKDQTDKFNFIIIGGFSKNDLTDTSLENCIDFKGVLDEFHFESILKKTHIMISPNKPFVLSKNAFDGFPLATSVTASLFGNVNFMTDYFNESKHMGLEDGNDFFKINNNNIDEIVTKIQELHADKDLMKRIAQNGRNKILHLYSFEKQITPRIEHFKKILL